jgi:hypothetical protein
MNRDPSVSSGKHEPPTKRSWYVSVATSTLRAVILVAAAVIGIVFIRSAFPGNASQTITTLSPTSTPPKSPTSSPSTAASSSPSSKPRVKGVTVQVLNGTSTTGLASIVSGQLKKDGYSVRVPGNVKNADRTTIYFQDGFKPEAEFLKQQHFPEAVLAPAPSTFPADVDITVVLGPDFSPSPSP